MIYLYFNEGGYIESFSQFKTPDKLYVEMDDFEIDPFINGNESFNDWYIDINNNFKLTKSYDKFNLNPKNNNLSIPIEKGFLIFALNNKETNYIQNAILLTLSIHQTQTIKNVSLVLLDNTFLDPKYFHLFDKIIRIHNPGFIKEYNFKQEANLLELSPYQETIKIEADFLLTNDLKPWWNYFKYSLTDLFFPMEAVNFRNEIITNNICRQIFVKNQLPNLYNGLIYFKKNKFSEKYFKLCQKIFNNSEYVFKEILVDGVFEKFTTDVGFSLAYKMLGYDRFDRSNLFDIINFVHMKTELLELQNIGSLNWLDILDYNIDNDYILKINGIKQRKPFHYHIKEFCTDELIKHYEKGLV